MPDYPLPEKLHTQLLSDYHCHCDYSIDAEGTIDDYCRSALARGLAELCFTTHYDSNPKGGQSSNLIRVKDKFIPATPENLEPYVDEVRSTAEKYQGLGLTVKLGVEYGWYAGCEESAQKLIERFGFDYVLCGIHEIDEICFCCRSVYKSCFERFDLHGMLENYFKQIISASESELFDTIAHFDYYKKYGLSYYGPEILNAHRSMLPDLFASLIDHHTCLEVNTAGMRKGLESYYPSTSIINEARRAGVAVRYLGSDAHKPQHVGYDFDLAAPLVEEPISDPEG